MPGAFRAVASSRMCGRVPAMFTGLVVETGTLLALEPRGESARLTLRAPTVAQGARIGQTGGNPLGCEIIRQHHLGAVGHFHRHGGLARGLFRRRAGQILGVDQAPNTR